VRLETDLALFRTGQQHGWPPHRYWRGQAPPASPRLPRPMCVPHRIALIARQEIGQKQLRRRLLLLFQIWCKSALWGWLLDKHVKYNHYLFIPFLFGNSPRPTGHSRWQIFALGDSNDADSFTDVLLGVSLISHSIFWGKIVQNNFLGSE